MPSFYDLNPSPLVRARRASEALSIQECARDGFTLWVFCVWCGRSHITDASDLMRKLKRDDGMLEELEERLRCQSCGRQGVKLIPTDRTTVSFDRMVERRR